MIRAVLDANVLISGALAATRPESIPGQLIRAWEQRRFQVVVSAPLLAEVTRNLARLHVGGRLAATDLAVVADLLRDQAEITLLTTTVSGVAAHSEDDLILATAVSAGVSHLVTGDKALLALDGYQGITICPPRVFLALVS